MNKPVKTRVTEAGMVFTAAPSKERLWGPQPLPGSRPRNWESRKRNECAAIVKTVREPGEWPIHYACCLPTEDDDPYCPGHNIHVAPNSTAKELIRGLRRYTT